MDGYVRERGVFVMSGSSCASTYSPNSSASPLLVQCFIQSNFRLRTISLGDRVSETPFSATLQLRNVTT